MGQGGERGVRGAAVAFIKVQRVLIKDAPRQTLFLCRVRKYDRDSRGVWVVCHIALASSGKWKVASGTQHAAGSQVVSSRLLHALIY